MLRKIVLTVSVGIIYILISGCLYRGDGVFKQIGDTDYKAKISVMNLFVVADGRPTEISGAVYLEDHFTPLRNSNIILKKNDQATIVSSTKTDNSGAFAMSGLFANEYYTLEIDSPDYVGRKVFLVEPSKNNRHDLTVAKR